MDKEIVETEKNKGLKHYQEIITKVDVEIDFRNREIKAFKNEHV